MKKTVNDLNNCQHKVHSNEPQIFNNSTPTQLNKPNNNQQPLPKYSIGNKVVWAYVKAHDYGVVVSHLWLDETVHKVTGWHYLIRLHSNSFSYPFPLLKLAFLANFFFLIGAIFFNNLPVWLLTLLLLSCGCTLVFSLRKVFLDQFYKKSFTDNDTNRIKQYEKQLQTYKKII